MDEPVMGPGLCECGCGGRAPLAKCTDARWGHVEGMPVRFIIGHSQHGVS
jgi:hypothetical protein